MQLPFSEAQFLDIFAAYNAAVWPAVVLLWAATCVLIIQLARDGVGSRVLTGLAAVHWLWSGLVYHAIFFTRINAAAWLFAAFFVAEGLGFVWYGMTEPRPRFALGRGRREVLGGVFMVYSLTYPALVILSGHSLPRAPAFAVPCPTTIFTAGLLFAADTRVPRWLMVVPIAWSVIAGTAAFSLGMTPDLMLFVAGACLALDAAFPRAFRAPILR